MSFSWVVNFVQICVLKMVIIGQNITYFVFLLNYDKNVYNVGDCIYLMKTKNTIFNGRCDRGIKNETNLPMNVHLNKANYTYME